MYPRLKIDLKKLKSNSEIMVKKCRDMNVSLTGVIKGCGGIPECAKAIENGGVDYIGSSRISQLKGVREAGIKKPLMLIRIPMISEAADVVRYSEYSLNSEREVIDALEEEAAKQNRKHNIILMVEIGDLREGIWDEKELIDTALHVENDCSSLHLAGVGTNIGCYGSVMATAEKLDELVAAAEKVEDGIGRELEIISGGGSTSVPRIIDGDMPERINHLRVGEAIIVGKDLPDLYDCTIPEIYTDCFIFQAEIVELKDKPSHPIGEIGFDAFRNRPVYEDRGIRKRAIIGTGKVDFAYMDQINPKTDNIFILGGASDHTILDIEDSKVDFKVGDIIDFDVNYGALPLLAQSPDVEREFI